MALIGAPIAIILGFVKGHVDVLGAAIVIAATVALWAATIWYVRLPVRDGPS